MTKTVAFSILSLLLVLPSLVRATTAVVPDDTIYESKNGEYRFTVSAPLRLGGAVYAEDYPVQNECLGSLERHLENGQWEVVWSRALLNRVAPSSCAVSLDGGHVVTFGDWGLASGGPLDLVVYDSAGEHVGSIGRVEFLTSSHRRWLMFNGSEPWWSRCSFDEELELAILHIESPPLDQGGESPSQLRVQIRLSDVTVLDK